MFSISEYSTANSPDAAYFIGGQYNPNVVAEFRDDQWAQLNYLRRGRACHGSITVGTQTMIVGGYWKKSVMILPYYSGCEDPDILFKQGNRSLGTGKW